MSRACRGASGSSMALTSTSHKPPSEQPISESDNQHKKHMWIDLTGVVFDAMAMTKLSSDGGC